MPLSHTCNSESGRISPSEGWGKSKWSHKDGNVPPQEMSVDWDASRVGISPWSPLLCSSQGLSSTWVVAVHAEKLKVLCNYSLFTYSCLMNAMPILPFSLLSQGLCNAGFNDKEKIKNWIPVLSEFTDIWASLRFSFQKQKTACSSLSSSSPWLGCFPFPYFGMMMGLSQSKVCQIWRKTTLNCLGQLLITAG